MKHLLSKLCLLSLSLLLLLSLVSCAAYDGSGVIDEPSKGENGAFDEKVEVGEGVLTGEGTLPTASEAQLRKIIKNYHVSGQCKNFDAAVALVESLVSANGGYIEASSLRGNAVDGTRRYASYTIRIPAEKADAFVGSLGGELNITDSSAEVKDISENYYSTQARLEELEAERDSLLAMMASLNSKTDYDFWLTLQTRLSDVRQQIAVYQGTIRLYDNQVAYSTVDLNFGETQTYQKRDSFGSRIGNSFRESWKNFGEGAEDFAVFLVGAVPTLLVLAAIAVCGVLVFKAVCGKKKKKSRSETPDKKE